VKAIDGENSDISIELRLAGGQDCEFPDIYVDILDCNFSKKPIVIYVGVYMCKTKYLKTEITGLLYCPCIGSLCLRDREEYTLKVDSSKLLGCIAAKKIMNGWRNCARD
jgi:hypothetical protein